jgi:periplasmic divalent cation tolerance protein
VSAVVVLCTVATTEEAERIAREVVERRLAACANLVPVTSIYRWKGELERSAEVLLVIKTSGQEFEALREAIVAQHAYEVPEVIALPVEAGHAPYLAWIAESVAPVRPSPGRPAGPR